MSTTTIESPADATTTDDTDYDLCRIGIELEYPVAGSSHEPSTGERSDPLRRQIQEEMGGRDLSMETVPDDVAGYMGSDHTGAEITSGVLNLHSNEPENWYREAVEMAEDAGHPFAATGFGDTVFGAHQHVSDLTDDQAMTIQDAGGSEWAKMFWCASIGRETLDPWRHGGGQNGSHMRGPRSKLHWEWRLPEPVHPEHQELHVEFWRIVAIEDVETALDWAREIVYEKDNRLTAIRQIGYFEDHYEDWPPEEAYDNATAEWVADLMGL